MIKVLEYLKYLGIFFIIVFGIAIVTSLIHLTGFNSNFLNKLSIILTAISFFIVTCMSARKTKEKGFVLGLKLALLFILFLIIINLIAFKSPFNIDRIIYYLILLMSGILGGAFGKNLKKQKK